MSHRRLAVALTGTAVLVVAVAVGVAVLIGRAGTEQPAAPSTPADPGGVSSTRLPSPGPSYWTPERMRSARPAPMPTE